MPSFNLISIDFMKLIKSSGGDYDINKMNIQRKIFQNPIFDALDLW